MIPATQNTPSPRSMEALPVARERMRDFAAPVAHAQAPSPQNATAAAVVGARFPIIAESLCTALAVERGHRVLDLGGGSGHIAISAGRRGCQVAAVVPHSSAYAEALLERDKEMVRAENLAVDFWRSEVIGAPFDSADFDIVASSFAAMFSSDQETMALEMLRLCRPGGRIGIASWTPDSFVAQLCRVISEYVSANGDLATAFRWGMTRRVNELFGAAAKSIDATVRTYVFRYESVQHCLDIWCATFDPLRDALSRCDAGSRKVLQAAVRDLIGRCNTATDARVALPSPYLETVVHKQPRADRLVAH